MSSRGASMVMWSNALLDQEERGSGPSSRHHHFEQKLFRKIILYIKKSGVQIKILKKVFQFPYIFLFGAKSGIYFCCTRLLVQSHFLIICLAPKCKIISSIQLGKWTTFNVDWNFIWSVVDVFVNFFTCS